MKKSNVAIKVFFVITIFIILTIGVAFGVKMIRNSQKQEEQSTGFRVELAGNVFTGASNRVVISPEMVRFEVKGTEKFDLEIIANTYGDSDFNIAVDDGAKRFDYKYSEELRLATHIPVIKEDDAFTIDCRTGLRLYDVLKKCNGGAEITLDGTVEFPYLLIITAKNGAYCAIEFSVYTEVGTIILPENEFYF